MSTKTDKEVLIDMGFEIIRIEKALKETKNSGLQPAMEWLFAHAEDPIESFETNTVSSEINMTENENNKEASLNKEESSSSNQTAQSLKCDICNKILKDAQAAEFHAVKSGHQSFSESTENIKPLTEEEKNERLRLLQERLKEKRLAKQKEEEEYEKQKEKVRRKTGKELAEARERMEKEELKRMYDKKRREQIEERKAKEKIKAQIEQDRKDRAARLEEEKRARDGSSSASSINSKSPINTPQSTRDYSETKIQIRLKGSSPLVHKFKSDEPLSKVYEFLLSNNPEYENYSFSTTFPRKVFTESDNNKSLKELDLVPSSVLVLIHN